MARVANSRLSISGSHEDRRIRISICIYVVKRELGEKTDQTGDQIVVGHDGEAVVGEEPDESADPEGQEDDDGGAADLIGRQLRRLAARGLDDLVSPREEEGAGRGGRGRGGTA